MCEVCRYTYCPSSCPNYKEPLIVYYCYECKEPIYDGQEFYRIGDEKYCVECMESFKTWAEMDDWWEE